MFHNRRVNLRNTNVTTLRMMLVRKYKEIQGKQEEHHPQRMCRGPKDYSQRTLQRTHRGLTEESQSYHRDSTKDSQRTHRRSASPLGTSRLRGCIMKANVNHKLEGDEEPGVFGRAQSLRFTLFWPWSFTFVPHVPRFKT